MHAHAFSYIIMDRMTRGEHGMASVMILSLECAINLMYE